MGTGLLLFGSMALFLIIGVPIAFALGAAVWTTIVFSPDFLVTTGIIGQRIFGGLESTSIMAIPFFILAGNLMTKGGISKRLVDFANSIVGGVRGGMALVLAGLVAKGTTKVEKVEYILRGYENIDFKLNSLGANIERKEV